MVLTAAVGRHGSHLGNGSDKQNHEEPDGDGAPDDASGATAREVSRRCMVVDVEVAQLTR